MKMLLVILALATAPRIPLPLDEQGQPQRSDEIYIGSCEIHALVKTTRKLAAEKFPKSWDLLLLPAAIMESPKELTVYFKLPDGFVGGTPQVDFDLRSCEPIKIYQTQ